MEILAYLNMSFTGLVVVIIILVSFATITKLCGMFCTWIEVESEKMGIFWYVLFLIIYVKLLILWVPSLFVLLL